MPTDPTGRVPPDRAEMSWDEALARLEDFLLSYPRHRALPGLEALLAGAGVPEDFLRNDERALKVLHEAVVDRPLGSVDAVARARVEVELLTLEVELLTDRLRSPSTTPGDVRRAAERLTAVRDDLARFRHLL